MKIGVSNMSWGEKDNARIASLINKVGFDYVESVYSKIDNCLNIKAIQSIFYNSGINDLNSPKSCAEHVKKIIKTCKENNISVITFGSPSMRRGSKKNIDTFLKIVDEYLDESNIKFCVEPNAKFYGAEYYNTLEEIVSDIQKYQNITSMIDVGNSLLEGKNPIDEYQTYQNYVSHIHFAAPGLDEIKDYKVYKEFYIKLKELSYNGMITYEFAKADKIEAAIENFYKEIVL